MPIEALSESYIDETYGKLVQTENGEFADGLGNPITIPNTQSIGIRIYTIDNYITSGLKGIRHIPFKCDITKIRAISNVSGSIEVTIKKMDNTIIDSVLIDSDNSYYNILDYELLEDEVIKFDVNSNSIDITDITIFFRFKK